MIRIAAVSAALLAFALPAQAQALRTEDLIGRWGVAAYWSDSDAAKVTAQARGFCSQPYVITRGAEGSARMFEAFEGRPQDVVVQGGQIVTVSGSARATKAIQSWNGSVLVFNYFDDEPKRKYGNMVFVRCGR
ncbi:MAG: hypothetical protein IOD03_08090 [Methylocystis sp.]|nr:hypothetical protein [Methylocystis sp.]MCA3583634.1 hypothetical protein [Methylocystis sp.]MCA3593279.1 hypothetical protein [Methylocystis sp.]